MHLVRLKLPIFVFLVAFTVEADPKLRSFGAEDPVALEAPPPGRSGGARGSPGGFPLFHRKNRKISRATAKPIA